MKNFTRSFIISVVAIAGAGAVFAASTPRGIPQLGAQSTPTQPDKRPIITPTSVLFGAYDPHADFANDPNSKIEHLFLPWEDVDLSTLSIADDYAMARNRTLLITVEPWSWDRDWRLSPEELLQGVQAGRYDENIRAVCSTTAQLRSPVIMRFAQEMDEVDGQFTWAQWSGEDYIGVYQRFVRICRESLPNVQYMWSPKGLDQLQSFYPGDDYADLIGLSVFGYQPYDEATVGHSTNFPERLRPGYDLVKDYGKPVWVAEAGYEGQKAYIDDWAQELAKQRSDFPELVAVVYFNDREVYPWPDNFGLPNWRVADQVALENQ